jgi:HSP20 family protein
MANNSGVRVKRVPTIQDSLDRMHDEISLRAFELSNSTVSSPDATDNWLRAERELMWTPAVEVRRCDGRIEVAAAMGGVNSRDLDVQITPDSLLIQTTQDHHHEPASPSNGEVYVCEFSQGRLFRAVDLPERVDPNSVNAVYRDGLLRVTAQVASSEAP